MLRHPHWANNDTLQAASENHPALKPGDRGDAVALLQEALTKLGFELPESTRARAPDTTPIRFNGVYNDETARKIVELERRNPPLDIDRGVAGKQVLTKMDELLFEREPPPPVAHDIRNLPDYIDNVAFAVDMDPFRGDYNIYYKTPAGVHSSYPVAASTVQRSPPGAPGFVQQVFPSSAAGLQALANANARHHDDQGRPLGIVYGFYRLHTQAIVPTSFSPDSTPRILAGIQAKDAHMRQVAGAMRDLLVNFALPIPAGRLAVAAGGRVINYLVGRGGRITASRPSSNTIQSAPGRLNNMDAMTELANTRAAQGVEEIRMSQAEYRAALQRVFPGQVDDISRMVDEIGQRAAQRAINDPLFIQAVRNGNVTQAGTLFHSAAAIETRAVPASALPQGWTLTAEEVIQAGAGGSRTDLLFRGPAAQRVEIDWKTTGRSAMSSAARQEMQRHAGQITVNIGGTVTRQESRSWVDYVRALLHARGIPWP